MFPHERSLVKQLEGQPFALIGVNSDADREDCKKKNEEAEITWRSFWNGPEGTSGPISKTWNVHGWPTIYVIDGDGKIRFKNVRGPAMSRAIETLLKELGVEVAINDDEKEANKDK